MVRARQIPGYIALAVLVAACGAASAPRTPTRTVAQPVPAIPATGADPAIRATNTLALSLLARLGPPDGNTVFSPYSVETALAMVDQGAAGATGAAFAGLR